MTTLNTASRDTVPSAGPFNPGAEAGREGSEMSRAMLTSLLALYPVLATVGVVLISLALSASA